MNKAKLLIVDDETDVLALNAQYLEARGYEVRTAQTLAEARASIWETPPDLIVLDVQLPDGSGYDFCAEIRNLTTAPIIYLTCMSGDEAVLRGLRQGGTDYMTKPYNLDVLAARISAQLRLGGGRASIEIPPLSIDLLSGRAFLNDEDLQLTPKELQLLALLAGNAGCAFSQNEIRSRLWGGATDTKTNAVKVHISNLRHKLRLDDGSQFELSITPDHRYVFQKVRFSTETAFDL